MQKNNLLKLYKLNKACFVSMVICTVMLGIAGILCEEIFDASKEETTVIFITKIITVVFIVVSVVGLFITIYFFVKLSKKYNNLSVLSIHRNKSCFFRDSGTNKFLLYFY